MCWGCECFFFQTTFPGFISILKGTVLTFQRFPPTGGLKAAEQFFFGFGKIAQHSYERHSTITRKIWRNQGAKWTSFGEWYPRFRSDTQLLNRNAFARFSPDLYLFNELHISQRR